ncbi:MAG: aerobic carbon-monoxide dehydrogenase large subunit, partial [Pseudonocardiales bacterium]|nr:aerobic carbon-monoxide dehydrogenase large subunit [Pseudonocardiales bacterium]
PSLAVTQVNHVGEAVAVIAARDKVSAQDALEAIEVEYEPLPVVLNMEHALADGAQLVHPNTTSNRSYTWEFESGAAGTGSPIDDALASAEVTVKRRFIQQRLIPAFMEPRSMIVQPVGEGVTIWSATQIPHILRTMTALVLGIPEQTVRVIAPDVGGGFGGKLQVTPEEFITTLVARRLGKPAKYTESRSESLMAAHHGRDQIQDITITAKRDGTLTGLDVHLFANMGAYIRLVTAGVPILGAFMYPAIYKLPAYRFVCEGVFTTKTATDAYRGAGRPEATFAVERIMDELAVELGMDPMELRRKNWITHEEFPFTTVCGLTYDSGNYEAATAKALDLIGWDELRREQAERRERKDPVQLGLGISTFTEMCGLAPSRVLGSLNYAAGGWENASVRMLATGKVEVVVGTSPHGQGHETAFSQIVADRLGVAFDDIEIIHGDTQSSVKGMDSYGSRSLVVGGIAVVHAADKVVAKARRIAAHQLEANEDDLEFAGGSFNVKGMPSGSAGSSMSMGEIAFATFTAHNLPDGMEPSLDSDATFDPENFSFPHGTHLCAIDVDTETGRSTIRKYVCVDDVGTPINPLIVEGQVHGGLAQGIAQALFEEAVFDDAGNLTTGTFVDYTIPSAADLPSFTTDRTETPATSNPLGVKGVGEAGTIASTPAVVNAIVDALRPFGVNDIQMPATPERVWRAVHSGAEKSGRAEGGTTAYGGASTSTSDGSGAEGDQL